MKLKITTTGLDQKINAINDFIKGAIGKRVIEQLAQYSIDRIYKRVKSGKGVSDDQSNRPTEISLKRLSDSYIAYRKGNIRFYKTKNGKLCAWKSSKDSRFPSPVTGEFGTPGKTNLTLTGQMLNSLDYKTTQKGFKIFIKNTKRTDRKLTNKEVSEYVSKTRPFLALTDKEQDRLKIEFLQKIRLLARNLNSILTRR